MDIMMRASQEITGNLSGWTDDTERPFWRGAGPRKTVDRVYFVRDGFIVGWAMFSCYAYREAETVQGDMQGHDAFVLKGPFNSLKKRKQVPENFLIGQWRWRYISDDMRRALKLGRAEKPTGI